MLQIESVSFSYGKRLVLKDINLELSPGKLGSLLGVNGSGKSTFLKTINGILKPSCGTVLIDRQSVSLMNTNVIAKKIGYMPQKSNGVHCTVFDAVLLGRIPHMRYKASGNDISVVERVLKMLGIEKQAMYLTSQLSGGELQKVVIARALAQEPQILLLDEPINHLDIKNQIETISLIKNITKSLNLITLIVLHDLNTALRFTDEFIMMKDGSIYASGSIETITPEHIKDAYNLDVVIQNFSGVPVVIPTLSGYS